MQKTCSKCKENKDVTDFNKASHTKDGLRTACKECTRKQNLTHYYNNKEAILAQQKEYFEQNKEKIHVRHRKYNAEYYEKNKQQINTKRAEYEKKRKQTDINFFLRKRLRTRLASAIRDNVKVGSAVDDLGCSIQDFKVYLEYKFYDDMSWENKSEWEIDHIIPLASFDLSDPEQLKKACHYTNLQPLWKKDHTKKTIVDLESLRCDV
jgi:hypothetical protein